MYTRKMRMLMHRISGREGFARFSTPRRQRALWRLMRCTSHISSSLGPAPRRTPNPAGMEGCGGPSRIEKKQRPPTLRLVTALSFLVHQPRRYFPTFPANIEMDVMARVQEMYETIQGNPSRKIKRQIELLESAIGRADERKRPRHL